MKHLFFFLKSRFATIAKGNQGNKQSDEFTISKGIEHSIRALGQSPSRMSSAHNRWLRISLSMCLAFTSIACEQHRYAQNLHEALGLSGANRVELEKVLTHYSQEESDSLKLKAAKFLISNMDVHFSYKSKAWDDFQVELDTLFKHEDQTEALDKGLKNIYNKYASLIADDLSYVSDLQTIRADFLIHNIEKAFESWQTPYSRHLNFDDFCEYILPYRAGREPLSDWRNVFQQKFIPSVYSRIAEGKDSIQAIDLCDAIKAYPYSNLSTITSALPDHNTHLLSLMRIGNCKQYCLQAVLAARCLGVPVSIDFTPPMGHT
jgi:hypothetical protein